VETKAFARHASVLLAGAILLGACSSFPPDGGVATLAEITKACTGKKPGDTVTVRGKDVACQTPAPEVAGLCGNRAPGENVRLATGQQVTCPPACCYINGCYHPINRECL
jgi:hypothetical protein